MNGARPPGPPPADASDLRQLARARLHAVPSAQIFDPNRLPDRGDHDLNPGDAEEYIHGQPIRRAAVLVPVVARSEGLTVLFTQRTDHLPSHAGQVAFPGGKMEAEDDGPLATALREAEEEIGLARHLVEPIGFLDSYQTGSGFRIVPAVGLLEPGFDLCPDAGEVAAVFEVPLAFLLDPANHDLHKGVWRGRERRYYAMTYAGRYIWGATAGMVRNLYERLTRPCCG